MAAPLYTTDSGLLFHAGKILVMTVGLPARGKTHVSRALERYLRWLGIRTAVISLGDYRRKRFGGAQHMPKDYFTLGVSNLCNEVLRWLLLLLFGERHANHILLRPSLIQLTVAWYRTRRREERGN